MKLPLIMKFNLMYRLIVLENGSYQTVKPIVKVLMAGLFKYFDQLALKALNSPMETGVVFLRFQNVESK